VTFTTFVPGTPKPQGSMKGFAIGGKVRLVPASGDGLAAWRSAVSRAAYETWGERAPDDSPVAVAIEFWLPRPKSAPKRRIHPDRTPDIDKLARAVLDSLTGIVFTDDARVVELTVTKRYATERPTGAYIQVTVPQEDET
jgi:crossover junction endodeoxyribonuclease RusA